MKRLAAYIVACKPDVVFVDVGLNRPAEITKALFARNGVIRNYQTQGRFVFIKGVGDERVLGDSSRSDVIHRGIRFRDGKLALGATLAVYSDALKSWMYPALVEGIAAPDQARITFNADAARFKDGYFEELSGSYRLERRVSPGGREREAWVKKRRRREAWDCLQYALAASLYMGDKYHRRGNRVRSGAARLLGLE